MRATDIKTLSLLKDKKSKLEEKKISIAISVSLASGLAWKEKVSSFYEVIAREVLEVFDQHLLDDQMLHSFNKNYIKINIENKTIYFNRNNLFLNVFEKATMEEWLKQELLIMENKQLPPYLTTKEKQEIFEKITQEEISIINQNYNRQELNSDRFPLNLNKNDEEKLIEILTKSNYFSLSIYEYVREVAKGDYKYDSDSTDQQVCYFKETYNNYILEIGAYISKAIETCLKNSVG